MITKSDIVKAWAILRKTDSTIPDETLDFMKDVSLKALEEMNKIVDTDFVFSFHEIHYRPGEYYSRKMPNGMSLRVLEDLSIMTKYHTSCDDKYPMISLFHFNKEYLDMVFYELKDLSELFQK